MDHSFLVFLIGTGGTGALWVLHRHRFKVCPKCKGTGKVHSSVFTWRYMACPRCSRKGEVRGTFGSQN